MGHRPGHQTGRQHMGARRRRALRLKEDNMTKPVILDLSHHNEIMGSTTDQAVENLQKTLDSGILGMIHKCTEGVSFTDDACDARRYLSGEVGMMWGMYHFLRDGSMGDQVGFFLDQAAPFLDDNSCLVLDYEDPSVHLSEVADFLEQLEEASKRTPKLYTGFALKDKISAGEDASRLVRYPLWLAQYASAPTLPKGWSSYWLWQYSQEGSVPGVYAPTDVNAYEGTVEDLVKSWSGSAVAPEPKPPKPPRPPRDVVRIGVKAPATVGVQLTVNGTVVYKQEDANEEDTAQSAHRP